MYNFLIKPSNFLSLFFYIIILSAVGFLFSNLTNELPLTATSLEMQHYYGLADPASYALGGWTLYQNGGFTPTTIWLIHLWPPGFFLFQALVLKIFGANAPMILILRICSILLFAVACNFIRLALEIFIKRPYALLLPLTITAFLALRIWLLGQGIVCAEPFSISLFLSGFACLLLGYNKNKISYAIWSGVFFALSAYNMPQYEVYLVIATINLLIIFIISQLWKRFHKQKSKNTHAMTQSPSNEKWQPLTLIVCAVITFHVATAPFRIYNYVHTHSIAWSQGVNLTFHNNFVPTKVYQADKVGWVALGGGNIACQVVGETVCNAIYQQISNNTITPNAVRNQVILAFFKHPVKWLTLKVSLLPPYWFNKATRQGNIFVLISTHFEKSYFSNGLLLLAFLFSAVSIFYFLNKSPYAVIIYWIGSSVFISYVGIFIFIQYQVDYFYFFKILSLVTSMFSLALLINHFNKKQSFSTKLTH